MTSFALEQRIRYEYPAPVTNLRQRLMVLPPARHGGQRCVSSSVVVAGPAKFRTRSSVDRFGNHVVRVTARRVPGWVEFTVNSEVETDDRLPLVGVRPDRRYLAPTPLTAPDTALAAMSAEVGPEPAAICSRVHSAFVYEYGVTGVSTTAREALAGARGVCQDYAHVMLSVCRLAGIPARYVSGHLVGEGGSHAWVEVLRPGRGASWVAEGWDPTHARPTDDRYVTIAVGRDYADVAPLSGTYDGDGTAGTLTVSKRVWRPDRTPQHAVHDGVTAGKHLTPIFEV